MFKFITLVILGTSLTLSFPLSLSLSLSQVFEKALDEPYYGSMYAQLCLRLNSTAPNFEEPSSQTTVSYMRVICQDNVLSFRYCLRLLDDFCFQSARRSLINGTEPVLVVWESGFDVCLQHCISSLLQYQRVKMAAYLRMKNRERLLSAKSSATSNSQVSTHSFNH